MPAKNSYNKKDVNVADLPHNGDAERSVLGSALVSKDALYNVLSSLEEEDFFEARHQLIYRALKSLEPKHTVIDIVTVTEELMNTKDLEAVGGTDYLLQCSETMVALSTIDFYIRIVSDQSTLRKLLIAVREIDKSYRNDEIDDVNNFIGLAEGKIKDATEKRRISTFKEAKEVASIVEKNIANVTVNTDDNNVTGYNTGYRQINKLTQGFQRSEMIIVAARPSVGKTALALNFAYQVSTLNNVPVAIFSLEMSSELLIKRLIASRARVPMQNINTGKLNPTEKVNINEAIKEVGSTRIYIDDTPGIKLMDVVAKCRKLQASQPDLGLIVIDYLGLVQMGGSSSKNADSRQEEVRKISLTLKQLALELKIPVIVVSQLSRDVEKRGGSNRPMLSDLRDSGSIEQDADVVMLLYREDYYSRNKETEAAGNKKGHNLSDDNKKDLFKDKKMRELGDQMPGDASYVDVNIAKNRNGQVGNAGLFFYKAFGLFESPSKEWEDEMQKLTSKNSED